MSEIHDKEAYAKIMPGVFEQYGKNFCCAPWNTLWTSATGDIKYCCASSEILGDSSLTIDTIINSPQAKEIRRQFLNNEQPESCKQCWDKERGGNFAGSARELSNVQGFESIIDSIAHTKEDGHIDKHNLKFIDVIWTNKCNFACLHCVPSLSSTINNTYEDVFSKWLYKNQTHGKFGYPNPDAIDNSDKIEYILKNADTLDQIHFNGGEPFLQADTFTLLDELMKAGYANKINLWFHTNGSVRSYKNIDIIEDYLKKWGNNSMIIMSHDHFGKRGEYFRYGYNEDKWLENFHRFKATGINLHVSTSLTLFNILTLHELMDWYYKNKISINTTLSLSYVTGPDLFDFSNVKYSEELKPLIPKVLTWSKMHLHPYYQYHWIEQIKNCEAMQDMPFDFTNLKEDFIPSITALDEKRNTNFLETFPELEPLYRKLKNDKSL